MESEVEGTIPMGMRDTTGQASSVSPVKFYFEFLFRIGVFPCFSVP